MRIVIDMNLSPRWVFVFVAERWEAHHWSEVGDPKASDEEILSWARNNGCVVFTHDLDFGALLAATKLRSPSVIQVRTDDVFPEAIGKVVAAAIRRFEHLLTRGALISVDEARARA